MTREEREKAIDVLKISAPVMAVTQEEFNDYIQTLNKIMNWLEQEPCTDAISRQAAIDEIINLWADKPFGNPALVEIKDCIEKLSPVTPQPCGDAISRNKVIVQLSHLLSDWDDDWNVAIRKCIETVKGVQPVTPAEKQEPREDVSDINDGNIYECPCGYGWDKSKVVRHHFCPNCGRAVNSTEQEPCDAVSRKEVMNMLHNHAFDYATSTKILALLKTMCGEVDRMPSVTPQYTDAEIQRMQKLEQAEIQKAYEIGKAEGSEVLDKIRAEIDGYCSDNRDRNDGLYIAMRIIDKYKTSPTGAERSEKG